MASAGQAQAHSSQPMHFSSPSGHRLSWWWPWKRGAVGRFSSGYWTVSTFRNISWKVTPNPLMGLRKSSTGDLLGAVRVAGLGHRAGRSRDGAGRAGEPDAVVVGQVQRGDLVGAATAGPRGRGAGGGKARFGLGFIRRPGLDGGGVTGSSFGGGGPGHRDDDDDGQHDAAGHVDRRAVLVD